MQDPDRLYFVIGHREGCLRRRRKHAAIGRFLASCSKYGRLLGRHFRDTQRVVQVMASLNVGAITDGLQFARHAAHKIDMCVQGLFEALQGKARRIRQFGEPL